MDSTPLLEVNDLCCRIAGHTILEHVTFSVSRGEIFGVMGMSGAGKSTLLHNLMGLVPPECGDIRIDGQSLRGLDEEHLNAVRASMGMCFQYAALFDSLTVFENVAFGLRRQKMPAAEVAQRVAERLETVGMTGTDHLMPSDLSGGMRKRIGIARALATNPQLVLYDEPTAGLDPVLASSIDSLIVKSRDRYGVTSVVVTHDVEHLLSYADRALMLYEGRVIEIGTPDELHRSTNAVVQQFMRGSIDGPIKV
jgi:phospholipid/cholesterol/gamma-HCH transport system ATP-binding protein